MAKNTWAGQTILLTGGTGYIGSHTCISLLNVGCNVVILDNLRNSRIDVLDRIAEICGKRPEFVRGDVRDRATLDDLFRRYPITAVVHFAGLKSVAESVHVPLEYYENNVAGSLELLLAMQRADIKTFVFSSSATVYGSAASSPLKEDSFKHPVSPYGKTKLAVEEILEDMHTSYPGWRIARLRYFNPAGAHPSGLIGEDPQDTPSNLLPFLSQVAIGMRRELEIFGNDYPTVDGTCIRDYIHIMDLAAGHVAALDFLKRNCGLHTLNLGTGHGVSVLEVIHAFECASNRKIPYKIAGRRQGDIAAYWADSSLAKQVLGWQATLSIKDICLDMWNWQTHNIPAIPEYSDD